MSNERTLRIALVGAPGSGKSELASKIALDGIERKSPVYVIDRYVESLSHEVDIAMGYLADYVPNLMCAMERFSRERRHAAQYIDVFPNRLTCGTVIESACYAAMRSASEAETDSPMEKKIGTLRMETAMNMLSMVLAETWDYTHVFYLPLRQDHDNEIDLRLDHSIRDALAMLGIDHTPLTDEDPALQALEVLKERDADPATAEPTE